MREYFLSISVVIPTYNSMKTFPRCLESATHQSSECREIIVVDRFSQDGLASYAKANGATVIQSKASRSAARNIGVAMCSASGVLFVDSDMILSKSLISECVGGLETHHALVIPEVSIGTGFWAQCKALDKRLSIENELMEAPRCFRRETFLSLGGYV